MSYSRRFGRFIAGWLVLLGGYFLFVGEFSFNELTLGLAAALVTALFAALASRSGGRELMYHAPWSRLITVTMLGLFRDSWRVGGVLFNVLWRRPRGVAGRIYRVGFVEGQATPEDAGRRGLVTLAVSLAPNGIVTGIPPGQDRLEVHRLAEGAPATDRWWPL